jgi:predicted ATPase
MNGTNLRCGSSGTRLLLTLLGLLLNGRFSTTLVDEPEIGLSPRIQAALARLLYNPASRQEYFPHLRQLFVATHSHIFLDRATHSNNYVVAKAGKVVSMTQVQSVSALHQLQFNMLGANRQYIARI